QVPPGAWSTTDNCGQTSVLMVASYFKQSVPTAQDISAVDDWMLQNLGSPLNNYNGSPTSTTQLATVASGYFGFTQSTHQASWTITDLQNELNHQRPVIVAVWTNMIVDPSTQRRHFMVLRGMDDNFVYVNDPGHTK